MPLSTSSFEAQFAKLSWLRIAIAIALAFLSFVMLMELTLAGLGYHATTLDSKARWTRERIRASELGSRALIMIGASRIQLDMDMEKLRQKTGLEPVQLAIDGSSFVPVLKGLANDPSITGTILVDYTPGIVEGAISGKNEAPESFEKDYENELMRGHTVFSLSRTEARLTEIVREHLRSYADSATPLLSLAYRIFPYKKSAQYLVTLPDRSRFGDYKNVSFPSFYYARVARTLAIDVSFSARASNAEQLLKNKISSLQPVDNVNFIAGTKYLRKMKADVESHGGRLLFVEMPISGMVREINDKSYPRATFLNVFEQEMGAPVLISEDIPTLKKFICPDGSHLDLRDRSTFTEALVHALGIDRKT